MPVANSTPVHIGMVDKSGEQTGTMLYFEPILDDGTNWDDLFDQGGANIYDIVKVPMILLTKLNLTRSIASVEVERSSGTLPAAADAQREWATRFVYLDTVTNKKYSFTIPAPVDSIVQEGTDVVDLGNALVAAFITVFEANCVSPEGNAVSVLSARVIGRNS